MKNKLEENYELWGTELAINEYNSQRNQMFQIYRKLALLLSSGITLKDILLKMQIHKVKIYGYGLLASQYIDKKIKSFREEKLIQIEKANKRIKRLYGLVIQKFGDKCHVMEMPHGIMADASHKWKLAPCHYERKYYTETLKKILSIVASKGEK